MNLGDKSMNTLRDWQTSWTFNPQIFFNESRGTLKRPLRHSGNGRMKYVQIHSCMHPCESTSCSLFTETETEGHFQILYTPFDFDLAPFGGPTWWCVPELGSTASRSAGPGKIGTCSRLLPAHHRSSVFSLRTSVLTSVTMQWPLPPAPHHFPGKKILSHWHQIVTVREPTTENFSLFITLLFTNTPTSRDYFLWLHKHPKFKTPWTKHMDGFSAKT